MIRVCVTIASLDQDKGGPSRSVPALCQYLAKQGVMVHLFYGSGRDQPEIRPHARLKLFACPSDTSFEGALLKYCQDHAIQIIHDNGTWLPSNRATASVAAKLNLPLVLTPRGMLTSWAMKHKFLKKRFGWWLFQAAICLQAALLHATSDQEAADLRALGLKNPNAVIPNAVEIPIFKDKPPVLAGKKRRLLFLSRLHPQKGTLSLIRAVGALRQQLAQGNWIVTLAGQAEPWHLNVLKRLATKLNVMDLVEFIGPIKNQDKWDLYRSADIFVLPTYSENFGLVIAEALGCGVPVITTHGAPWKELETHRCGWWHPVGQKELESALLQALKTSPKTLKMMGERGRKMVHRKYEWPEIGQQLRKTYEWILHKGSKPEFIQ